MGDTHLSELREALDRKGWKFLSEQEGDGYGISGVWRIQRSTRAEVTELYFEGLDDLRVLPMAQAYGCHIKGQEAHGIYFGSMKEFRKSLPGFISGLDRIENEKKSV
jgi:hypothetical protein